MLDASLSNKVRRPTDAEILLIKELLAKAQFPLGEIKAVDDLLVCPMMDGGMGSLYLFDKNVEFSSYASRNFQREIAEVKKIDVDGVTLSISLNVDQDENPYELDVFKADFTPIGPNGIAGLKDPAQKTE